MSEGVHSTLTENKSLMKIISSQQRSNDVCGEPQLTGEEMMHPLAGGQMMHSELRKEKRKYFPNRTPIS